MSRSKESNPSSGRPPTSQGQARQHADPPAKLNPAIRGLVSLVVAFHLVAIVVAPMSIKVAAQWPRLEPPGGGDEPPWVRDRQDPPVVPILEMGNWCTYYLSPLYLNHGYSFFAPEPGVSHLVAYEIARTDGTTIQGRFPELGTHWPRLRYHRYKMLADQAPQIVGDLEANRGPEAVPAVAQAYGRHLLREHVGTEARLRLIEHRLLWPGEVLAGKPLDDENTYRELGVEIVRPADDKQVGSQPSGRYLSRGQHEAIQIPADLPRRSYR